MKLVYDDAGKAARGSEQESWNVLWDPKKKQMDEGSPHLKLSAWYLT